jgi:hypothetical protein
MLELVTVKEYNDKAKLVSKYQNFITLINALRALNTALLVKLMLLEH